MVKPLRDSTRSSYLTEIANLTTELSLGGRRTVELLDQWSGGYPTAAGQGGSGHSDRTGTLAVKGPDIHQKNRQRFDLAITRALEELQEAHRIMLTTTTPPDIDSPPPPCLSCQRQTDHRGKPIYEASVRVNLCRWCSDWLSTHGAWPPIPVLRAHQRGERITDQLIRRLTGTG